MVLNLDFTVSVTQNFVDSANLSNVLSFLESKEEDIVGVDDQVCGMKAGKKGETFYLLIIIQKKKKNRNCCIQISANKWKRNTQNYYKRRERRRKKRKRERRKRMHGMRK